MNRVKKSGLAGLGHVGRRHLAQYKALGLFCATADPNVDASAARALGSDAHYASFEEMLTAERPQAVSICLPSFMHRDNAILALENGADVLVEKPLALELTDIDDIIVAARAFGRRVMTAHVCRFMGQYRMAKELLEGGTLGKPLVLNAWRNSATPKWSSKGWLGDPKASGGTVMDLQIHDIDLACWLLGPVRAAAMVQRQSPAAAGSGFHHVLSTLNFENEAVALLEAGHLMPDSYVASNGYRLVLEGGALEFSMRGKTAVMHLYEPGHATDLTQEFERRFANQNAFSDEISHFIDCLNSGREFACTARDGRRAVEAALKLMASEMPWM